jgi:hypothetical protein
MTDSDQGAVVTVANGLLGRDRNEPTQSSMDHTGSGDMDHPPVTLPAGCFG